MDNLFPDMDGLLFNEYKKIITGLDDYFNMNVKGNVLTGKGGIQEIAIQTPFLLYDNTKLELRLREEHEEIFFHDNSKLCQYLLAHGISVTSDSFRQKKYNDFIDNLMDKNNFGYDDNWMWFYKMHKPENKPDDLWKFIHSLQMISDLVLAKNLKTFLLR